MPIALLCGSGCLTGQVALLSLIPIVALGGVLAWVLRGEIVSRTLADAAQSARLVARLGVQPRISPSALRHGLTARGVRALDQQLQARSVSRDLARIKIWNDKGLIVYSDDHRLIGMRPGESDELENALAGRPNAAAVITPARGSETASEVGLGRLVEVYVPLRLAPGQRPAGAFEVYLSYAPIAKAIASAERTIALLVALGLALLWAVLYRIVASASRRLRHQARENGRLARYDQLTGLPNRTLFSERLTAALSEGRKRERQAAVLLLDVDGFKQINDTLGHKAGDTVLREVARRLRVRLDRGELAVARLGNDEYAVLEPNVDGRSGALATAAAVRAALERPVEVDGVAVNLAASIGVALAPEHGQDAETLLRRADVALARARAYRSSIESYSPSYDELSAERLRLLGEVRPALERGELVLFYQPKLELGQRQVVGVEALVRWRHPERGLLAPGEFMPAVEQTALIGPLTAYVIDQALAQLAAWRSRGLELEVAVNLSTFNLHDPGLPALVGSLLERHSTPRGALTVEVTESEAMASPERALRALGALRSLGVGVSIDDFGSGHASIAYLVQLPATELKIDRSLAASVCDGPREEAIVRSAIDLGRHLGLRVVAEGIETDEVAAILAELGCECGQGYLFSKPLPPEQLGEWLESWQAGEVLSTASS